MDDVDISALENISWNSKQKKSKVQPSPRYCSAFAIDNVGFSSSKEAKEKALFLDPENNQKIRI